MMHSTAAALLLLLIAPAVDAAPWTLATSHMSLTFGADGVVSAVTDTATGRNRAHAAGHSLVSVVYVGAATVPPAAPTAPTKVAYDETTRVITASFPNSTLVTISVQIADEMIMMTVLEARCSPWPDCTHARVKEVLFGAIKIDIESAAADPVAVFDGTFALVLFPSSLHTYAELVGHDAGAACNASHGVVLQARATAAVGFAGRGMGLWGGPRAGLDAAIAAGERKFGLPSPMIDGVWAKRAPDAKKGYFLISMSPTQLTDTIKYAAESGMKYITLLGIFQGGAGGHYNYSTTWGGHGGDEEGGRADQGCRAEGWRSHNVRQY